MRPKHKASSDSSYELVNKISDTNIMEENESCAYVRLTYADTILTKSILPYNESILDCVGNDLVKINKA